MRSRGSAHVYPDFIRLLCQGWPWSTAAIRGLQSKECAPDVRPAGSVTFGDQDASFSDSGSAVLGAEPRSAASIAVHPWSTVQLALVPKAETPEQAPSAVTIR